MGTPPDALLRLIDRFDQDRKVFLSGDYQTGTRDWGLGTRDPNPNPIPLAPTPSCAALGWDMDNICEPDNSEFRTQRPECRTSGHSDFWFLTSDVCITRPVNGKGLSETSEQVIHEESIKVAGATKAPHYAFTTSPAANVPTKRSAESEDS